jgi:hypothetical protein
MPTLSLTYQPFTKGDKMNWLAIGCEEITWLVDPSIWVIFTT